MIVKEFTAKIGKGGYDARFYLEEWEAKRGIVSYKQYSAYVQIENLAPTGFLLKDEKVVISTLTRDDLKERFNLKGSGQALFSVDKETYEKIKELVELEDRLNAENEKAAWNSIETRLVVVDEWVPDCGYYVHLRFNKPEEFIDKETIERFDRMLSLLSRAKSKAVIHKRLKRIAAPKGWEVGKAYTLDDLENAYKDDIEKGLQLEEEAKQKKEAEAQRIEELKKKAKETGQKQLGKVVGRISELPSREEWELFGDVIEDVYSKYGKDVGVITVYEVVYPDGRVDWEGLPNF